MKLISIPNAPPSPNELRRKYRHPHAYRKLRQQWEHDLFYGVSCSRHRQELIAQAAASPRMRVAITIFHPRVFDQDNLVGSLKPILDALRNLGFIVNDSIDKLELMEPTQVKSKEKKTLVAISPIAPRVA